MMSDKEFSITKGDITNTFLRSNLWQGSWNFERMHALGFMYTMVPTLKRLYPENNDERKAAMRRHLEFFNTQPFMSAPIVGVTMAMEEQRKKGAPIDDAAINGLKIGMMGPLAGVGDPIFWGTLRPIIGAFAATFALNGSFLGPIIFFALWNLIRIFFMWYTQELGYVAGNEITKELEGGILQKLTTGASILGMFVMGVLVPRWTTMNFPLVISQLENDSQSMVDFQELADMANANAVTVDKLREVTTQIMDGLNINETTVQTLGDVFNELLPGLMPLLLTLAAMYLMKKKNVSAITLIFGIFILGIVLNALGVMG